MILNGFCWFILALSSGIAGAFVPLTLRVLDDFLSVYRLYNHNVAIGAFDPDFVPRATLLGLSDVYLVSGFLGMATCLFFPIIFSIRSKEDFITGILGLIDERRSYPSLLRIGFYLSVFNHCFITILFVPLVIPLISAVENYGFTLIPKVFLNALLMYGLSWNIGLAVWKPWGMVILSLICNVGIVVIFSGVFSVLVKNNEDFFI